MQWSRHYWEKKKNILYASTQEKSGNFGGINCMQVICIIWMGSPKNDPSAYITEL